MQPGRNKAAFVTSSAAQRAPPRPLPLTRLLSTPVQPLLPSAFLDLFIALVDDWGPLGYLAYIVVSAGGWGDAWTERGCKGRAGVPPLKAREAASGTRGGVAG